MSGTLVFIPAWNEEASLPGVLSDAHDALPGIDVLVIDDGSTDGTAAVAAAAGADVVSFGENRGLRAGIAEGYRQALERGYDYCGRLAHVRVGEERQCAAVHRVHPARAVGDRLAESQAHQQPQERGPEDALRAGR